MELPLKHLGRLDPGSGAIVKFIQEVTEKTWPSVASRYGEYFEDLKCDFSTSDELDDEASSGVTRGTFAPTSIKTESASWVALNGSLFGLNFFTRWKEKDVSAAVLAGYDSVRSSLIGSYGPSPAERLDQRGNRAATWLVRDTRIELYAHLTEPPTLQVGLSHNERNASYEHRLAQTAAKPKA